MQTQVRQLAAVAAAVICEFSNIKLSDWQVFDHRNRSSFDVYD